MVESAHNTDTTDGFVFELISPAKVERQSVEHRVLIPGKEGDFMVLSGHTLLVTSMRAGVLTIIKSNDNDSIHYFVDGGFVDVGPDHCTILASECMPIDTIKRDELATRRDFLLEDIEEAGEESTGDIKAEVQSIDAKLAALDHFDKINNTASIHA